MRLLIRQREITADAWRYPGESGDGPRVSELADWLAAAGNGPAPGEPLAAGVRLAPTDEPELLAPHVGQLSLVIIGFPRSGDGRGYSQAQLLRGRLGYRGELRASGDLWRDQLFLLARCGFDSFELAAGEDLASALRHLDDYSVAYQRASGTEPALCAQRIPAEARAS